MRINIDETYWIGVDELQYTLYKHNVGGYKFKEKKSGIVKVKSATDDTVGYYPNIRQCITKVIEMKLSEAQDVVDLEEYLVRLGDLIKDLKGKITE